MSRERKRAARRAQQVEQIRADREIARVIREGIERGDISALHWHGELPWSKPEHRQVMVVEVEARAEALYEDETDDEARPEWHRLSTLDRMRWRSAAYTIARVEVGWDL